ncbi:hypothetical protein EJ04DRAFT_574998 [Polyplosphaeria fusca]|uniref:NWD NACHT-NTPase N-terminal domain-containing protein n=1 Tax=Polyplosphaeria fusca TaxID=682080 RepID=A0A9P4R5S1_9PLEO|nr:hypothetical protein EJ04DRAFT_574998 [Polyplosphaeria fusca]
MSVAIREDLQFNNIWQEAYQQVKIDKPKLLDAFEQNIVKAARELCHKKGQYTYEKKLQAESKGFSDFKEKLQLIIKIQKERLEDTGTIKIANKEINVHDAAKKTIQSIIEVKAFIDVAVGYEPHAAAVWAGISICLPYLINAWTQEDDALDGLNYIQELVTRYSIVQTCLTGQTVNDTETDVRAKLRVEMINLYFNVLTYQLALLNYCLRNKALKIASNVFAYDDWKSRLQEVKDREASCKRLRDDLSTATQQDIQKGIDESNEKLDSLLEFAGREEARQELKELDRWLHVHELNPEEDHGRINQTADDETGQWFVDDVQEFLEFGESMISWGRGGPGVGKSVLMSIAINDIRRHLGDYGFDGLAYIYLQGDKKLNQTPLAFQKTILRQLRPASNALTKSLKDLRSKGVPTPNSKDLSKLLRDYGTYPYNEVNGVKQYAQARFVIFIDGLDEASPETRNKVLSTISNLDQRFFRIIMTSRLDVEISTPKELTTTFDITASPEDLDLYLRRQLRDSNIVKDDSQLEKDLALAIMNSANGMFLHARFHVKAVLEENSATNMKRVAEEPHIDYAEIYSKILDEHINPDALRLFAWLTYARRILDLETLTEALTISLDADEYDPENKINLVEIVRRCRGLAELDGDSVRFTHQTVPEFLRTYDGVKSLQSNIAATCFKRLAVSTLRKIPGNGEFGFVRVNTEGYKAYQASQHDDGEDENNNDYGSDSFLVNQMTAVREPVRLHVWARQESAFAEYAGDFALAHLRALLTAHDQVTEPMWRFLSERPSANDLTDLSIGENSYYLGFTPLHVAVYLRRQDMLDRLLKMDIEIDSLNKHGDTPLMCAAMYTNEDMLMALIHRGADINIRDKDGKTAFDLLTFDISKENISKLMPVQVDDEAVVRAAAAGLKNVLLVLLERGIGDPDSADKHGRTPLSYACEHGKDETVDILLKKHVNIDSVSKIDGSTPLHFAIESGNIRTVRLLIQKHVNVNIVDHANEHALLRVAWGGRHPERHLDASDASYMMSLILKRKPDLEIKGNNAGTALWEAVNARKYPDMVDQLIKAGSDIHREYNEVTPFQSVARDDPDLKSYALLYKAEVKLAVKLGKTFDPTLPNSRGNTVLHTAAAIPQPGVVLNALPSGGLETRNLDGRTPLFLAMHRHKGAEDAVRLLLARNAETDVVDHKGNSLLDQALIAAERNVVDMIITRPCSIEADWDMESERIQRFSEEDWFGKLKDLIIARQKRPALSNHAAHAQLHIGQYIYAHTKEIAIVRLEVPDITVSRVVFSTTSNDQGRSWFGREHQGSYHSPTWFEVAIKRGEKITLTRKLQHNVHTSSTPRTHTQHWLRESLDPRDVDWIKALEKGDTIVMNAYAAGDGWHNHVSAASIDIYGTASASE